MIARAWDRLRQEGRAGLVPYLTAGHPSPAESRDAIRAAAGLADLIEIGVPFSDPLADGPTIQRASLDALRQGMTLGRTLELVADAALPVPVVLFSYLNPVLQYGVDALVRDAQAAGVAGILLTDLPAGADPALERQVLDSPLDLIRLVAPSAPPERVAAVVREAEGFIYLVARLGVTGASRQLSAGLAASVGRVREATTLPIAVGFGISTPTQAREVAAVADGVVVGSALVDALDRDGAAAMASLLAEIRAGLAGT